MYTQELINEVKCCFPTDAKMHELAENGNVMLGRYLDDASNGSISLDNILLATSLNELQEKARVLKRKVNLYKEWCKQDPRRNLMY